MSEQKSLDGITFTQDTLDRLRDRYDEAIKLDEKLFVFDGFELVTGYAKYLIQYIENGLPKIHG